MGYKDIKTELDEAVHKADDLKVLLQTKCPHRDIIMRTYCNDDFALICKTYATTYECKYCGKFVSYDEDDHKPKSKEFLKMEKLYYDKKYKN